MKNRLKKYWPILAVVALFAINHICVVITRSDTLTIPNRYTAGAARRPSEFNDNYTAIETWANGLVCTDNIKNGCIVNADINASAAISGSKFACASYWATMTFCDSSVDNADALHKHAASHIEMSSGLYTASNVETALVEIATAVGYSAAASPAATTTAAMYYMGVAIDDTNVWPTAVPGATVTVATGSANLGIVVDLTSEIALNSPPGSPCIAAVPIAINNVNLSTSAAHVPRYTVMSGAGDGADTYFYATSRIVYRPTDGWSTSTVNLVSVGTPYLRAGSTCTSNQTSNYILTVTALR